MQHKLCHRRCLFLAAPSARDRRSDPFLLRPVSQNYNYSALFMLCQAITLWLSTNIAPYPISDQRTAMHTIKEKAKLIARVRRIKGQAEALERALEQEIGCADVLMLVASMRGAVNG